MRPLFQIVWTLKYYQVLLCLFVFFILDTFKKQTWRNHFCVAMWPSALITETGTRAFEQLLLLLRHKAGTVRRQEENEGIKIKVYFTFDFPFVFSLIRFPWQSGDGKKKKRNNKS